jgi:flagellar FliL protein
MKESNMADNELEDDGAQVLRAKQGSGLLKIVLIVLGVIILVAGTIGTTLYFSGIIGGGQGNTGADMTASTGAETGSEDSNGTKNKKEPIYYAFEPEFVVNFSDGNNIRYLQVTLEIMTYDQRTVEDIERHMPVIRNNLIMMFSSLSYDVLSSVAGKRKLQEEALAEIRSILKEKTGREGVEQVYFTGFVMQ